LSLTASIPASQGRNLVSERLNSSHDIFLSHLASFIGRLHLQSQSSASLLLTIRQSAAAGRALLTIVEIVCTHDIQSAESLEAARTAMYDRINYLLIAAQELIKSTDSEDEDVVMPEQNGKLLAAATGCVKAAGECVAKTKFVIERIGDFEFEPEGLDVHVNAIGSDPVDEPTPTPVETEVTSVEVSSTRTPPPPLVTPSY
jgi:hypothetical protein